jgi:hypothetical protein
MTLNKSSSISDFENNQAKKTPWLYSSEIL